MIDYDKLSDPQQEIVNLRSDKSYVIQGGAGTGKTVVALFRAKKFSEEKDSNGNEKKSIILVHNKPLENFVNSEIKKMEIKNCVSMTYHSWLGKIAAANRIKLAKYGDNSDCENILSKMSENDDFSIPDECKGNILIDESQDFPTKLLTIIRKVSDTVTCFIDSNQSIQNLETTLVEALTEIDVESARTLDVNYRSTFENASVAKLFWSEKGIYPKTLRHGNKPTMVKTPDTESKIAKIAEISAKYNFKNENVNIGIFVNNKAEGEKMYDALCDELGKKYIQYRFDSKDDAKPDTDSTKIDFSKPGVKLFTYNTIKGLDFDAIVIGDNMHSTNRDAYMNLLYMTLTRATSDIYICYEENKDPDKEKYIVKTLKEEKNKSLCEWN